MAKIIITIDQEFNASVSEIFSIISDHEALGKLIGMKIKRIVDSSGNNINGLGSIRLIKAFGSPEFEEEIISFEENKLIEYTIIKGSPLKNHRGRQEFSQLNGKTSLHYTIEFEPRVSIPLWGSILKIAVKMPIAKGIKKLAERYN